MTSVEALLRSPKGLTGALVVTVVILAAIGVPALSPNGAAELHPALVNASPSLSHPFGGDELGRDVFTRAFDGARGTIGVAVIVVAISATIGTLLGALAGYTGRRVDALVMRLTDFFLVFPWLLPVLLLVSIIGAGLKSVVLALVLVFWMHYARVVRAETLRLRELEFVQASRAIGTPSRRILIGHILPHLLHVVLVLATLDVALVMTAEAALTYLGLGVQPPTPTLGGMIADGQSYLTESPWIMLAPAGILVVTVIGINLLGDWLRDVLDPSMQEQ